VFDPFFNHTTTLQVVNYPQDPAGGPIPTGSPLNVVLPCSVQQDRPAERQPDGTYRRGTVARLTVFFWPDRNPLAIAALAELIQESRLVLDDGRTIVLQGPPYDQSGQGVISQAVCTYVT
jgi:hypothetical protein